MEQTPMGEALELAAGMMCRHPRDWSLDHRDAWLWGLIVGWDEPALRELQAKHRWSDEDVARLCRLHEAVAAVSGCG